MYFKLLLTLSTLSCSFAQYQSSGPFTGQDDQDWTNVFQHQSYSYFLKEVQHRNFNYAVYQDKLGRTTPLPTLNALFFEKDRVINPTSNYVSMSEVFGKPRTIDDDLEMPLNQPVNNFKVSFHRYYPYYNPYHPTNRK
ncbi:unnamed protein product [Auanema sp. JU1783]|nr:unnamed protein product [Auanema sp. JU1783]